MPIEFRCTQCNRLLRTPDGTSGRDAKCPECGAIVKIPVPAPEAPPPPSAPFVPPALAETNPNFAPARQDIDAAAAPTDYHSIFKPTTIDISDVLTRTWTIFKARWSACLAVVWGTSAIVGVCFAVLAGVMIGVLGIDSKEPRPEMALIWLFMMPAFWWQTVAVEFMLLKIARGEPVAMGDLLAANRFLLPGIGAALVAGIATMAGLCLCIVPGVIVLLMFSQCLNLIIDRGCGPIEALRLSMQITRGNKVSLLLIFMLTSAIGSITGMATCGLAAIAVQPFNLLMVCVAYLNMTGQRTAAEPRVESERQFG